MKPRDAFEDTDFRVTVDNCIRLAREALALGYEAIGQLPLDKKALAVYERVFDKFYFRRAGLLPIANVVREMVSSGYTDMEARAIMVHLYPKLAMNNHKINARVCALDLSFVYVLECSGFHKIGLSRNIPKRIAQLKTGTPTSIHIECYVVTAGINEKELHKHFQDKRVSGEWFSLTHDDICRITEWARSGIPTYGINQEPVKTK